MSQTEGLSKEEIRAQKEREFVSPYRWVALICIGLMHAALMGTINQPAALSTQIVGVMGADVGWFAQICTVGFLTGAIFSIPMGILADKWNVKNTMGLGLVISLIGAIWRIFCGDPITLYISCFVMGMGLAGMNANSPKFLRMWFGYRRVTTAMGIYVGCAGIGVAGCMAAVNFFGDPTSMECMTNVWIFDAVVVGVATVIWFVFGKTPTAVTNEEEKFTMEGVKQCLTNKHLWITAIAMILFMSVQVTYQAQFATAAQYVGIDAGTAAGWSSVASLVGIPGNFFWTWLSDRIGRIKAVLVPVAIVGVLCFTAAWYFHAGTSIVILICIGYFFGFCGCGFIKSCVGRIPTISPENMGTAGGIQTLMQNLGAYVIPSVLATIAAGDYIFQFYMVSGLMVAGILVVAFLMPEFGEKGKLNQERLAAEGK